MGGYWICETVRVALVETWGDSNQLRELERARRLDSNNAELYYRTGTLYMLGAGADSQDPEPWLRRATELNPKLGKYWLALGRVCFLHRDQACSDRALELAVKLSPMTPSTEWEVATYDVLNGRFDESFAHLRRLLEQNRDDEKQNEIFRFMWRAFDPGTTWRNVVGTLPDPRIRCAYLAFVAENQAFDISENGWRETAAAPIAPSFEDAKPYLQQLLKYQRYREAASVWRDLQRRGAITDSDGKGSLVFNGSFEGTILNAGFDWNLIPAEFVAVEVTNRWAESGKHSLQVEYTVPHNTEGDAAYQLIPVAPNQRYLLTAYSRSEGLSSDSGPRLRVQDPQCPNCLDASSEMTTGTTEWHQLRLGFSTAPATQIVRLSVWRARGRTFPMDIAGTFWLDSVSLSADGPPLPPAIHNEKVATNSLP